MILTPLKAHHNIGNRIGDIIEIPTIVHIKNDYTLDELSLPLRNAEVIPRLEFRGASWEKNSFSQIIILRYQSFHAPKETIEITIPERVLIFKSHNANNPPVEIVIPNAIAEISPILKYPRTTISGKPLPYISPQDFMRRIGFQGIINPIMSTDNYMIIRTLYVCGIIAFLSVLYGIYQFIQKRSHKNPLLKHTLKKMKHIKRTEKDKKKALHALLTLFHTTLSRVTGKALFKHNVHEIKETYPALVPMYPVIESIFQSFNEVCFEDKYSHNIEKTQSLIMDTMKNLRKIL